MNIKIKQLQGGECSLEVIPTTKILDIKKLVAQKLTVPVEKQKLLLLGRALIDDRTVESYPSIKNGTKLYLVVQKPDVSLLETATKCFKKTGLSDTEARAKAKLLFKVIDEKFQKLSLDDIERMSLDCLMHQCGLLPPPQEREYDAEFEDALGF